MSSIGSVTSAVKLTGGRLLTVDEVKNAKPGTTGIGPEVSLIQTTDKNGNAIPLTPDEQAMVDKMQAMMLQAQDQEAEQLARMRVNMQAKQVESVSNDQEESA